MWNWKLYIILPSFLGLMQNASGLSGSDPLVHSKVGVIRGLKATDGDYSMFMGIPYATVNKSNPFGVSTPYHQFDVVFEANDDTPICPQVEEFNNTIVGSLDCLRLNIYVPNTANSGNLLPVLVYIYGGLFMIGFSGRYLYGPRFLMNENIILVTFNYRVGPYGFMCLNIPEVPGNQGLKDQQLALKWIKDNIEEFGGDPNKITVTGSSSGATSVDFHLIYSKTKLFDKVIMQSGTALYPWSILEPDLSAPTKLSEHLGFTPKNTKEALRFLSTVDPNLVTAATSDLGLKFRPCVEQYFPNVDNFIYDYPINIKKLNLHNVTVLLGCNSHEALSAYENIPPENFTTLNLFYDDIKQYFNFHTDELIEMEETVRQFYIGGQKISRHVKNGIVKLNSDFYFNYPVVRTIKKYLVNGAQKIYFYIFAYSGQRNFLKDKLNVTARGASHADELGYLFDISYMNKIITPKDQLIINRITNLWANFVKFGNPTPATNELLSVQWPTVSKDSLSYLYINSELKIKKKSFKARMAFWDLLYTVYEKAQIGYDENTDEYMCSAEHI